jgi:TetR/AcrR family transcriptional regulator of autoinduction and epiphytic fitness
VSVNSTGTRRRRPEETRRRILEAAHTLFLEHGYAATTMNAIADDAGVAVQTVYFKFHTKGELLMQLVLSIGADDPGAPRHQDREWYREMIATGNPRRQLALLAEHGTDIFVRIAPLIGLVEAALASDAKLKAVWDATLEDRRRAMREQMEVVARNAPISAELGVDGAADVVFALQRPETLRALTIECRWSVERYKAWLYRTLCQQILLDPGTSEDHIAATAGLSFAALSVVE